MGSESRYRAMECELCRDTCGTCVIFVDKDRQYGEKQECPLAVNDELSAFTDTGHLTGYLDGIGFSKCLDWNGKCAAVPCLSSESLDYCVFRGAERAQRLVMANADITYAELAELLGEEVEQELADKVHATEYAMRVWAAEQAARFAKLLVAGLGDDARQVFGSPMFSNTNTPDYITIAACLLSGESLEKIRAAVSAPCNRVSEAIRLANWIAEGNPPAATWNTISDKQWPETYASWRRRTRKELMEQLSD